MQICSATIRLAGSVQNTVFRDDITPAEILVLQAIHGNDAVIDILPIEKVERSQNVEWDRLTSRYDRSGGPDTPDGKEDVSIVSRLFPGAVKRLPVTLSEIGLETNEAPEPAPEPEKPRRNSRKAADPAAVIAAAPTADAIAAVAPATTPAPAVEEAPAFVEGENADKPATDPVGEQWKAAAASHEDALAAALSADAGNEDD